MRGINYVFNISHEFAQWEKCCPYWPTVLMYFDSVSISLYVHCAQCKSNAINVCPAPRKSGQQPKSSFNNLVGVLVAHYLRGASANQELRLESKCS